MIFLLIAGSYTPFCLGPLWGRLGWTLLVLVWTIAAAGIVLKLCWMSAPRWLSTGIYLGMGWLLTGGLLYTIAAAFYGTKWPGRFGFHEIWHLALPGRAPIVGRPTRPPEVHRKETRYGRANEPKCIHVVTSS